MAAKVTADAALATFATDTDTCRQTHANALTKLEAAERQAWLSLAGYKFLMFGYWASQWVLLKAVLPGHRPNPWKSLPSIAKQVCQERGWKDADPG